MTFNAETYKQYDHFKVTSVGDNVAHVEIHQPKTFNAFSSTTWRQYKKLILELDADPEVKCLVLSGTGPHFTSGLNLQGALTEMLALLKLGATATTSTASGAATKNAALYEHVVEFQDCIGTTARISTPSVAVAHGIAFGLAIDLLCTTTIRLAVKDTTRFSIKEIDIGLVADIGTLQRMPALVNNQSVLNELALTGREFKGEEALRLGFVSELLDTKELAVARAVEVAKTIANHVGWCIEGTKAELQYMVDGGNVAGGLERVAVFQSNYLGAGFFEGLKKGAQAKRKGKGKL